MLVAYPALKLYYQQHIPVAVPHCLYVEESGNPQGIPVLFLHGGPGAACREADRCFFNPEHYRIILFDQRGCGRSTPYAMVDNNDTQGLLDDIEVIRQQLGIERWLLFGGSWGSTLALLYAQQQPQRVLGLILRGVFLCRQHDIDWFFQAGASRFFPNDWDDFIQLVPDKQRDHILKAYYHCLTGDNEVLGMRAAKAFALWAARCATLQTHPERLAQATEPHHALALAKLCSHYLMQQGFLADDQILRDSALLADIPGLIIQGRYDMVCPPEQAFALQQAWPTSQLRLICAGHASTEPAIVDALIRATDEMVIRLRE